MSNMIDALSKLTEKLCTPELEHFSNSRFPYIFGKAYVYQKTGSEIYRRQDAFGMPQKEWEQEELDLITIGCNQVMKGIGYLPEKPFVDLGVTGFRLLFLLFHFEKTFRETTNLGEGKFLDKIQMCHIVEGYEVTYYNLVEYNFNNTVDFLENA